MVLKKFGGSLRGNERIIGGEGSLHSWFCSERRIEIRYIELMVIMTEWYLEAKVFRGHCSYS